MNRFIVGCIAFGCAASMSSAFADDSLPEGLDGYRLTGETETCLTTTRIDRTSALDDESILFEMKGDKVYLNRLNSRCPHLAFEDSFMYQISGMRLCRGDIITVLHNGEPGASCSLGTFELLEEVEEEGGEGDE